MFGLVWFISMFLISVLFFFLILNRKIGVKDKEIEKVRVFKNI